MIISIFPVNELRSFSSSNKTKKQNENGEKQEKAKKKKKKMKYFGMKKAMLLTKHKFKRLRMCGTNTKKSLCQN